MLDNCPHALGDNSNPIDGPSMGLNGVSVRVALQVKKDIKEKSYIVPKKKHICSLPTQAENILLVRDSNTRTLELVLRRPCLEIWKSALT